MKTLELTDFTNDPKALECLKDLIKNRKSILISGQTGTGKTSLIQTLAGLIPANQRVLAVEDYPQMKLDKAYPDKDIISWNTEKYREMNSRNQSKFTDKLQSIVGNLFHSTHQFDIKWLIYDEIRGSDGFYVFKSILNGTPAITSIHGDQNRNVAKLLVSHIIEEPAFNLTRERVEHDLSDHEIINIQLDRNRQIVSIGALNSQDGKLLYQKP